MSDHFQQAVQESRPVWLSSKGQKKAKQDRVPFAAGLHDHQMMSGLSAQTGHAGLAATAALQLGGNNQTDSSHFAQRTDFAADPFMLQRARASSPSIPLPMEDFNHLSSSASQAKSQGDLQCAFSLESPSEKVVSSRFLPRMFPGQGTTDLGSIESDLDMPSPTKIDSSPEISKPSFFGLPRQPPSAHRNDSGGSKGPRIDFPSILDDDSEDGNIWKI